MLQEEAVYELKKAGLKKRFEEWDGKSLALFASSLVRGQRHVAF
jgi:hypothetical protein